MSAKVSLNLPKSLFTAEDSLRLASNTLAQVKIRTGKGVDANGQLFKDYSTTPSMYQRRERVLRPRAADHQGQVEASTIKRDTLNTKKRADEGEPEERARPLT